MILLRLMLLRLLVVMVVFGGTASAQGNRTGLLGMLERDGACCTVLDYLLPGKVHFNVLTDLAYTTSQTSFWSAQEQSLKPTCIVIPTSTQDVSTAVTLLDVAFQASVPGCRFAVRGAGHTPQAGWANIDGGVTIDMQSINQVTISEDRKTVSMGPGGRWGNVYEPLDAVGLSMVGGRVTEVGIGGLVLGSGISFFSGRYGFSCDNIREYEIVLANGTITTASHTANTELFRALKGGSNNFGVVTRMDAVAFEQSAFWGGSISQPITDKDALLDWLSDFGQSETYDPYAALITNFAWVAGLPTIVLSVAYTNGNTTWPPPTFAALDAMPKTATTIRKDSMTSFASEIAGVASLTDGHYNMLMTRTLVNNPDVTSSVLLEIYDLADAAQADLPLVVGLIFTMTLQPLPHLIYSKSAATGGNVLGLDRFTDDLFNVLFTVSWTLPTDSARVKSRMQQLETDIVALTKERGVFNEFVYLNYATEWQKPIQAYGEDNVAFLRDVSRGVDPQGLFQKGVPGGFKLDM